MSGSIRKKFIVLVLVLPYFGESLATAKAIKYVPMDNLQCSVRSTLIDMNLDELHYFPFVISMNRSDGNFNTVEEPFGGTCVPNKEEDVNVKVFDIIKGINQSNKLGKHMSSESRRCFDVRKVTR